MKTLETFITKSYNLEETLGKIRNRGIPEIFNQEHLEEAGIEKPNSIHYGVLFKNLGLVDDEKKPVEEYFNKFIESEELARKVIASRMREAYAPIFQRDETAYRLSSERLFNLFRDIMGEGKSETFIQLVANTFLSLAEYADWEGSLPGEQTKEEAPEEETYEESFESEVQTEEETPFEFEQPKNQHEEFIFELMQGQSEHDYKQHVINLTGKHDPNAPSNNNGHHTVSLPEDSPKSLPIATDDPFDEIVYDNEKDEEEAQDYQEEVQQHETVDNLNEEDSAIQEYKEDEHVTEPEPVKDELIEPEVLEQEEEKKEDISLEKENDVDIDREIPEPELNQKSDSEEVTSTPTESENKINKDNETENGVKTTGTDMKQTKTTDNSPIGLRTHDEHVKSALKKRASLLTKMERFDEALDAYEKIIYYTKTENWMDAKELSDAIYQKAVILEKMKRYDEALEAYNELIEQYNWNDLG